MLNISWENWPCSCTQWRGAHRRCGENGGARASQGASPREGGEKRDVEGDHRRRRSVGLLPRRRCRIRRRSAATEGRHRGHTPAHVQHPPPMPDATLSPPAVRSGPNRPGQRVVFHGSLAGHSSPGVLFRNAHELTFKIKNQSKNVDVSANISKIRSVRNAQNSFQLSQTARGGEERVSGGEQTTWKCKSSGRSIH